MGLRSLLKGLYFVFVGVWIFVALAVVAKPAYAYVDPGSGLFLLQILSSTVVGFTFLVRKRIRDLCTRLSGHRKEAANADSPR